MSVHYGPKLTVLDGTLRYTPPYTPNLLIQVESSGISDYEYSYNRQRVVINGVDRLVATAPRSYRATRLTYTQAAGWAYASSNGYDVYGTPAEATNLLTYLQTFSVGDMLILNTFDEPLNNRGVFQNELITNFGATLQGSANWTFRCSYVLVAVKGRKVLYENVTPGSGLRGPRATLYLG
jgi:hypothetical protein